MIYAGFMHEKIVYIHIDMEIMYECIFAFI